MMNEWARGQERQKTCAVNLCLLAHIKGWIIGSWINKWMNESWHILKWKEIKENERRQKHWESKRTRSRIHGESEENWWSWKKGITLSGQKDGSRRNVLAGMLSLGFTMDRRPFCSTAVLYNGVSLLKI